MTDTITVEVTLFGETRTLEFYCRRDRDVLDSYGMPVVGRFPTGTKLHRSQLRLYKRNMSTGRTQRGATAATVDGEEYVADGTLYTHNRNVGRITGWYNEDTPESAIAQW